MGALAQASFALVALALSASLAGADPGPNVPVPIGYHANIEYPINTGRPLVLTFARPARSIEGMRCAIVRGEIVYDDHHSEDLGKPTPTCVLATFAGPGSPLELGPAMLRISVLSHDKWVDGPDLPVAIVEGHPVPKGGAGTQFDARFWENGGHGAGYMTVQDAQIKNGELRFTLMVDIFSFGSVHVVVDKDGTIVPQTIALPEGQPQPGKKIYSAPRIDAEATRSIVVFGKIRDTGEGRRIDLHVVGPTIGKSQRYREVDLVRHGDKGTQNSACYVKWDTRSHCPGED